VPGFVREEARSRASAFHEIDHLRTSLPKSPMSLWTSSRELPLRRKIEGCRSKCGKRLTLLANLCDGELRLCGKKGTNPCLTNFGTPGSLFLSPRRTWRREYLIRLNFSSDVFPLFLSLIRAARVCSCVCRIGELQILRA